MLAEFSWRAGSDGGPSEVMTRAKRAKNFGGPLLLATGAAVFAGSEERAGFGCSDEVTEGVFFRWERESEDGGCGTGTSALPH
jgi:hypothetical protein